MPTGMNKMKLTTNPTKDTEIEGNELDKKVFREMKKLESWFNPQATRSIEDYNHGRKITWDQINLVLFSADFLKEPTTYQKAVYCERKEDQNKWKDAINKELKEMEKDVCGKLLMRK
jgi:hypothetical protein